MATLDDLRGAFVLLEEEAAAHAAADEPLVAPRGRRQPTGRRPRRWVAPAIAGGVVAVVAVIITAIMVTRTPSHRASKHAPPQLPDVAVSLLLNGHPQPPNAHATIAAGSRVTFRVQVREPAGVAIHNAYLLVGTEPYGIDRGQPSGHIRVLEHVPGTLSAGRPLTATWTASQLFASSNITVVAQFDLDFVANGVSHTAAEQQPLLSVRVTR